MLLTVKYGVATLGTREEETQARYFWFWGAYEVCAEQQGRIDWGMKSWGTKLVEEQNFSDLVDQTVLK